MLNGKFNKYIGYALGFSGLLLLSVNAYNYFFRSIPSDTTNVILGIMNTVFAAFMIRQHKDKN